MMKGPIDPLGSEHGGRNSRGTSFSPNKSHSGKPHLSKEQVRANMAMALNTMAAEAMVIKPTLGGSVTDTVAGWLALHYAHAMHEQLSRLKGKARLERLRTFGADWALLRRGDQTSERLQLERERLALAERSRLDRGQRQLTVAMEAFKEFVQEHPQAQEAFDAFAEQVRTHRRDGPSEKLEK